MSTSTSKGIPVPENDVDSFDLERDIGAIAEWVDDRPGVGSHTTTERNGLGAPDLWPGKVIFNTTTQKLEINKTGTAGAANWSPLAPDAGDITTGTLGLARLPVADSGESSSTELLRADDSRLQIGRLLTMKFLDADTPADVGDRTFCETDPISFLQGRKVRFDFKVMYKVSTGASGLLLTVQRSINGGAWAGVTGTETWTLHPGGVGTDSVTSHGVDQPTLAAPTDTVRYRLRAQAHIANGQTVSGAAITNLMVSDVGPAS